MDALPLRINDKFSSTLSPQLLKGKTTDQTVVPVYPSHRLSREILKHVRCVLRSCCEKPSSTVAIVLP